MISANFVFLICSVMSIGCAGLLLRSYLRVRQPLLLWSSLCFSALAVANILLYLDLAVLPELDLSLLRASVTCAALLVLVVGLVWET